jgi:hypothetical protein
MIATTPPTSIHIALSVGEPVKNREMSELNDFDAETPKIKRRIPPARIASDTALFMKESSLISGRPVPAFRTRARHIGDFGDHMTRAFAEIPNPIAWVSVMRTFFTCRKNMLFS